MTSNMKCPFCETELEQGIELLRGGHILGCPKCKRNADDIFWFALIQAKQDLEIARKAADNSREKLAAFMHDTWGNWFAYQLNNSTVENLQRWGIQSNTPYSSLTETDKDKDRKFADKIIEIIKEQIDHFADVSKMIEHKEQI